MTIPDSANISGGAITKKGDQESVVGHVSDLVLATLSESFDKIEDMFSKLVACVKMPFHQLFNHYICLYSYAHRGNLWNTHSMYFMKNMEQELACLLKGEEVTGTPTPDI